MQKTYGLNRRRFCGATAATVAAGKPGSATFKPRKVGDSSNTQQSYMKV